MIQHVDDNIQGDFLDYRPTTAQKWTNLPDISLTYLVWWAWGGPKVLDQIENGIF